MLEIKVMVGKNSKTATPDSKGVLESDFQLRTCLLAFGELYIDWEELI
jgi:hypothetical protein